MIKASGLDVDTVLVNLVNEPGKIPEHDVCIGDNIFAYTIKEGEFVGLRGYRSYMLARNVSRCNSVSAYAYNPHVDLELHKWDDLQVETGIVESNIVDTLKGRDHPKYVIVRDS